MLNNIILILTISLFTSTFASFCHWNSGCPYKYFASKTSYNAIRGDIRDSLVMLKGCEPVSIWGLFRHGKRYPSSRFGKSMNEALAIREDIISSYREGHSSLCAQDIENLDAWVTDKKLFDSATELTPEGYEEMYGIGKRIRHTFANLLDKLDKYTFRPAYGKWIEDSAKAFIKGFNNNKLHPEKALSESDVMAPYLTCGKYQKDVQKNPNIYEESEMYKKNPEYLATKDRIQRRTGIAYELTDTNVTALYDLCRHTWSGVESKLSPWCALFTKDDLQVLEYIQDLRSYYRNGYGTPQSEIFGQVPLADLLRTFQKVKEGDGKKMTAYFSHATMLDMVYTSLGLFKDNKPLTSANRDRDRKWRSSANSAFSVNLVAVLNRCTKKDEIDYNVVFYLNEEPIRAICADGTCTWKEFEEKLTPFLNTKIDFCEFKSEPY